MGSVSECTLAQSASAGRVRKSHVTLVDGLWDLLANCVGKPRSFACSPSWTIGPSFTNTRGMFQPLPLGQNCGSKNCDSHEACSQLYLCLFPCPILFVKTYNKRARKQNSKIGVSMSNYRTHSNWPRSGARLEGLRFRRSCVSSSIMAGLQTVFEKIPRS